MTWPRDRGQRPGFSAFVFALVGIAIFAALSLWFAVTAPETVPSHFDASGRADDWSSKWSVLVLLVPLGLGISVLLSIRGIWTRMPLASINAPHKEYWFERSDESYFYDCLMEFMRINAGALALLFSTILISMFTVAAGPDNSGPVPLLIPTAGFLIVVGASVWLLFRRLQPQS